MHRECASPQTNKRKWLHEFHEKRKNRTIDLGVRTIETYIKEGTSISYRTVSEKSKELDPDGQEIHQNTIRKNQELRNYFLKHCTTRAYGPRKRSNKPLDNDMDKFKHIKQDRDVERVRQRYMKLTKPELVDLLIQMEQYIAHQNRNWLKNETRVSNIDVTQALLPVTKSYSYSQIPISLIFYHCYFVNIGFLFCDLLFIQKNQFAK